MKNKYTVKHIDEVVKRLTEYEKGLVDVNMAWGSCNICESAKDEDCKKCLINHCKKCLINHCKKCLINHCSRLQGTDTSDRPSYGSALSYFYYNEKTVFKRYLAMLKRANKNLEKVGNKYQINGLFKTWKDVIKARKK